MDKTDDFFLKAVARLEKYQKLWQLSRLVFMPTNTVNLLFECDSENYGQCVLKLCIPGPEVATELRVCIWIDKKLVNNGIKASPIAHLK